MRRTLFPLLCALAALLLPTKAVHAQAKTAQSQERGWGDSWKAPATDQQVRVQKFVTRCDALEKTKSFQKVVEVCNDELRRQPDFLTGYNYRGYAYRKLKKYDLALADCNRAVALADQRNSPDAKTIVLLLRAGLHQDRNDYRAASNDLRAQLKIDRANSQSMNRLAWLLATAPDSTVRNGREAVGLAKKSLAGESNGEIYAVLDTLAAAYAEANDYPRAVETQKRALEEAPKELKDAKKLAEFRRQGTERLRLFEQRQPYRLAQ